MFVFFSLAKVFNVFRCDLCYIGPDIIMIGHYTFTVNQNRPLSLKNCFNTLTLEKNIDNKFFPKKKTDKENENQP